MPSVMSMLKNEVFLILRSVSGVRISLTKKACPNNNMDRLNLYVIMIVNYLGCFPM